MNETDATRRKRLLYQATHRGFKEADLVIGGFATAQLGTMSREELDEFETLLRYGDHELYGWLKGGVEAPQAVDGPVFRRLRDFDVAAIIACG